MVSAVIFDWDGTLADTRKVVVQSFQTVLTEAGCNVSDEFIERLMGVGTKKTIIEAFRECKKRIDVSTLEKLDWQKIAIQVSLSGMVSLLDGAADILQALQGRTRVAVATMSHRKVIDTLLPEKGLRKYFDVVVSADDVANPKPDPEVFLVTAEKLKVDPKDCVVVEDSVFGIKAAKEAKMKCIAVSTGVYSKEELLEEKPDLLVSSLAEKQKILEFIFGNK
jgi:HAD superfamily hydrolase (TIGR01509 family)